jgi:hypothetical protein
MERIKNHTNTIVLMNKTPKPRRCKVCETVFTPNFYKLFATINVLLHTLKYSKQSKARWKIERKALTKSVNFHNTKQKQKKSFQNG